MKKNKNKFKKPNWFLYSIFRFVSKISGKFKFNLKIEKNEIKKVKGPYILLCNHESVIDFLNIACCTRRRFTIVISNSFYQSLKINPLIKAIGVIPKQQFQTNPLDIKKMKNVILNNRPLLLYPAGLMTENGITTHIPEATGKVVQWLNADIYIGKTEGSYFTKPKWSNNFRKGKITLNIYKLLSKEEAASYNVDDLQKLLKEHLYYNAYANQEKNMVAYKNGNCIEGLENVLYWCPKCKSEFKIKNKSYDTMVCECCGNEVYMDNFGFLNPKTEEDVYYKHVSDWYDELYKQLYNEIINNDNYCLESKALFQVLDYKKHQFVDANEGIIKLNRKQFTMQGIFEDKEYTHFVPIKSFPMLPFNPGKYFEVQDGDKIYRCYLENGKEVSKWINVLKIFYELNTNKKS